MSNVYTIEEYTTGRVVLVNGERKYFIMNPNPQGFLKDAGIFYITGGDIPNGEIIVRRVNAKTHGATVDDSHRILMHLIFNGKLTDTKITL